jgi:hypothetical protein
MGLYDHIGGEELGDWDRDQEMVIPPMVPKHIEPFIDGTRFNTNLNNIYFFHLF